METEQKYIKDLTEIRSMMERSSKFLSLSGLSGIMAGIYALLGAFVAWKYFYLPGEEFVYNSMDRTKVSAHFLNLLLLALVVLVLAIGTAIYLSHRKAHKNGEVLWNSVARRLAFNLTIPLVTGGIFLMILASKGLFGLLAPVTLIFYGLALLNASKFTFGLIRSLGIVEILLGLLASYYTGFGLLFWAVGFGLMHILYGIYMHLKYEK